MKCLYPGNTSSTFIINRSILKSVLLFEMQVYLYMGVTNLLATLMIVSLTLV